jgi:hypothetical protein
VKKLGARMPLVLAAIALALGVYVALVERHGPSTDDARAARTQLVPALARADVNAIEIDRGAQGRVTLSRDGAVPAAFADLLDAIDAAEIDREATADARTAGLDPPAARMAIITAQARLVVDIGARDASGRGLFVRRAGDQRIWVIGSARLRELVDGVSQRKDAKGEP